MEMFVEVMSGIAFLTKEELEAAKNYIMLRQLSSQKQIELEEKLEKSLEKTEV